MNVGVAQNLSDYAYYEVNPSDGSLLSRLRVSGHAGSIACEHDGEYISFQTNPKAELIRLTAQ